MPSADRQFTGNKQNFFQLKEAEYGQNPDWQKEKLATTELHLNKDALNNGEAGLASQIGKSSTATVDYINRSEADAGRFSSVRGRDS